MIKFFGDRFCIVAIALIALMSCREAVAAQEQVSAMDKQVALVHDLLTRMHSQEKPVAPLPVDVPVELVTVYPDATVRPGKHKGVPLVLKPLPVVARPVAASVVAEADKIAVAPSLDLATRPGLEAGVQAYMYQYHETVNSAPFMNNKGNKIGVETAYTHTMKDDWFLRGEGRFTHGAVDYSGSGSQSGNLDQTWEARIVLGRDYIFNDFSLAPYAGYGYRYLYNDARGLSSTGASGYRRKSEYNYIPLGVTNRVGLTDQSRLATNIEYDHFIRGRQQTLLGDVAPGMETLDNEQNKAEFAARGSVLVETADWSFGPWFNYWYIADSKTSCNSFVCGLEPRNKTTEFGLKVVRKIF